MKDFPSYVRKPVRIFFLELCVCFSVRLNKTALHRNNRKGEYFYATFATVFHDIGHTCK